jgi:hypothetical protein
MTGVTFDELVELLSSAKARRDFHFRAMGEAADDLDLDGFIRHGDAATRAARSMFVLMREMEKHGQASRAASKGA